MPDTGGVTAPESRNEPGSGKTGDQVEQANKAKQAGDQVEQTGDQVRGQARDQVEQAKQVEQTEQTDQADQTNHATKTKAKTEDANQSKIKAKVIEQRKRKKPKCT